MACTPNPYRPGFNQSPAVLAGRDEVLEAIREALEVTKPPAASRPQRDPGAGLYASRWRDATPREQDYLRALTGLVSGGGPITGGDVARELRQTTQAVSYLRNRLLRKGTIYADGRSLRFAVPGMAEWITTQPDD